MIRRLREATFSDFREVGGTVKYPVDHQPGMKVPKGGSCCANCEYLGKDGKSCTNKYFILWNGSNLLPAEADSYCSDWWEMK